MAKPLTPQQRIDRANKIRATRAARKAAGLGPKYPNQGAKRRAASGAAPFSTPPRSRRRHYYSPPPYTPPYVPPTPSGPVVKVAPPPDFDATLLLAINALEDALAAKFATATPTDEAEKTFERYNMTKDHYLKMRGHLTTPELKNEAATALRVSLTNLIKLVI